MPKRKTDMEKVREILRLCLDLNYSIRDAGAALRVSKTTVGEFLSEFKRTLYSGIFTEPPRRPRYEAK